MRKWTLVVVTVALTLCAALSGHSDEPKKADDKQPDEKKVKELMHKKLVASQKVLEGLATNNLEEVAKNADDLARIRKDVSFRVIQTAEYDLWSDEFVRSLETISKAAKDKNLEKAKLGYLSMTLSCFNCHTYVRDQKRVSIEPNVER
jgi:hypothetical protein